MINSSRILKLFCLLTLLNFSQLLFSQGSETHKFGYCINPLNLWYQLQPGTPPVPPYTITWTVNGTLVRTATALNTYSSQFGNVSYHDSLWSPNRYPAGDYVVLARMTNTSGYDRNYTWNIHYDSITVVRTDAPPTCDNSGTGSINIVPYGTTTLSDYIITLNPGNVNGTNFNNLTAGTYTVNISANPGVGGSWMKDNIEQYVPTRRCNEDFIITITQPIILSAIATNSTSATCGLPNGTVSVSTSGGTGTKTYQWSAGGATGQTVTGLAAGDYTVTVTDELGCTSTSATTITNSGAITATIGTTTDVFCFGGSTGSTSVSVSNGVPTYTYVWSTGPSSSNASSTNTRTGLAKGDYSVTVTDGNGCTASTNVTINEPAVLSTLPPVTTNAKCDNADGTAGVNPSGGTTPYSYLWSNGATTQTATSLTANPYTVTVTDNKGCTTSTAATVGSNSIGAINVLSVNSEKCFGLSNGNASVIGTGGTGTYAYTWSTAATTPSVTGLTPAIYTVTVSDGVCSTTTTINITGPPDLVIGASNTQSNCGASDGTANVIANGGLGPYSYLWSPGGATGQTATGLVANDYTVTVTDANSCTKSTTTTITSTIGPTVGISGTTVVSCNGGNTGSITLQPAGGTPSYFYTWNTNPVQNTNPAVSLTAGTYSVIVSDATGCTATTSATITEPSAITANTPITQTVCSGQSATLNLPTVSGGTPTYVVTWTPGGATGTSTSVNPTATTTYTATITDSQGCTLTKTALVTVNPLLAVNSLGTQTVCEGKGASISASATGGSGGPYTYNWEPGTQTGSNVIVTPTSTTDYTVTVTDNCGSPPVTSIVTITVIPPPTVQFTADITNGCAPLKVTLTNNTANSLFCLWEFGDGSSSIICADSAHPYTDAGVYSVKLTVTDNDGCSSSLTDTAMIAVSKPIADFNISSNPVSIADPSVIFTDISRDAFAWNWDFGDSTSTTNTSTLQHPAHTYSDTGKYCIKLIIQDSLGCSDSIIKCLTVIPIFTFYVPNAFSPNGDNLNETFLGMGTNIKKFKMLVFDRWGNMIFVSEDINYGWDGKVRNKSGELVQQDVYVYKIVLSDIFDIVHDYIGHVSVVR